MKRILLILISSSILLTACGSNDTSTSSTAASPSPSTAKSTAPAIAADGTGMVAFNHEESSPSFPTAIPNYVLEETQSNLKIRIFQGEDWTPFLERYREGNTMSCEPEIWIVRWRSNNPGITIQSGMTFASGEFGYDEERNWMGLAPVEENGTKIVGGTGYIGGASCSSPVFKWGTDDGSATLADVYYEYQIWKYKPKI
ncbi:MAG: hypothetical protein EBU43_07055 [Actinobacteria bacterium]|nr:hypothetical protein [Actinomycetota bacterium]NBP92079.1 hypothetical protein [Actinomycetota bacterium]